MSPVIKSLVEQSAVPLLTDQIRNLRTSIHNLEQIVFKTERDLQSYAKATKDLAEELNKAFKVRTHITAYVNKAGKQKYYRDPTSVHGRWAEWKKLIEDGVPIAVIARRWGIDRGSIKYAKKHNFRPTNRTKLKPKGYNESNYRPTANNGSDRFVWRGHQQEKQCRESSGVSITDLKVVLPGDGKFSLRRKSLGNQGLRRKTPRSRCPQAH